MNNIIDFNKAKKIIKQQKPVEYITRSKCDVLSDKIKLLLPILNELNIDVIVIGKNGEVDFLFEGEYDD